MNGPGEYSPGGYTALEKRYGPGGRGHGPGEGVWFCGVGVQPWV